MSKDIEFNADGVTIESLGAYRPTVKLKVEEAEIGEILDQIGLEDIFDHFDSQIIDYAIANHNLEEKS